MSENSEIVTIKDESVAPISNDRILYAMCFVVIVGTALGFVFSSWRFGFGFLIGGLISFVNYFWLRASLKRLFETAREGESSPSMAAGYFWRYLAIGVLMMIVFLSKVFPIVAFVLGLVSFAFAVMIEAVLRVVSGIFERREI